MIKNLTSKIQNLRQHSGFMKYFKNTSWLFAEKILRMVVGLFVGIWGSGKPRREFLYSEDMADAYVFLLENRDFKDIIGCAPLGAPTAGEAKVTHLEEIRNTHTNIGTGDDISIKELAYLIKDIVGYKGELYFNTEKPDGTMIKLTDPSKPHKLGWKHKVELDNGIKAMYAWYLKR